MYACDVVSGFLDPIPTGGKEPHNLPSGVVTSTRHAEGPEASLDQRLTLGRASPNPLVAFDDDPLVVASDAKPILVLRFSLGAPGPPAKRMSSRTIANALRTATGTLAST